MSTKKIRTLGEIFRIEDRADQLANDLEGQIEDTEAALEGVEPADVFVYDSGGDAPMTVGGTGIGNEVIERAGGTNIFEDQEGNFADVSWEQVIQRNPETIIILDYAGQQSPEDKERALKERADLRDVTAIKEDNFVHMTLMDTVLGVRAPMAVNTPAAEHHPEAIG